MIHNFKNTVALALITLSCFAQSANFAFAECAVTVADAPEKFIIDAVRVDDVVEGVKNSMQPADEVAVRSTDRDNDIDELIESLQALAVEIRGLKDRPVQQTIVEVGVNVAAPVLQEVAQSEQSTKSEPSLVQTVASSTAAVISSGAHAMIQNPKLTALALFCTAYCYYLGNPFLHAEYVFKTVALPLVDRWPEFLDLSLKAFDVYVRAQDAKIYLTYAEIGEKAVNVTGNLVGKVVGNAVGVWYSPVLKLGYGASSLYNYFLNSLSNAAPAA